MIYKYREMLGTILSNQTLFLHKINYCLQLQYLTCNYILKLIPGLIVSYLKIAPRLDIFTI